MRSKVHILVVDDETEARKILVEILEMAGYTVSSAAGGTEALRNLEKHRADLVICDVVMPEMDGFAVLEKVKNVYPHINVVMITGNGDADSVRKAFRMGADEFITKPFEVNELSLIIERACWHILAEGA